MDERDQNLELNEDQDEDEEEPANADGNAGAGDEEAAPGVDPVDQLKGLVTYMAANLIDEPAGVEVDAERRGPSVHLSLRVPEGELGKVIGRQGRIARAMRTVLMIAGSRSNVRASLDIEG
jgi:predicted RNA-binding protein YlqC (UPF0109 family)